jgi:septum formation protein
MRISISTAIKSQQMLNPTSSPLFVLASASPARRSLLQNAGFDPIVRVSDFDEAQIQIEEPSALVQALARGKAEVVAQQFLGQKALIVGCDSVMCVDGEIYGKPIYPELAIAMWQRMRGHYGTLFTGHCLIEMQSWRSLTRVAATTVHFANATDTEINSYVNSGEPLHCAGCFTLEGLGGVLVEKLEGCHTNVLGLSLPVLRHMLGEMGYAISFSPERKAVVIKR